MTEHFIVESLQRVSGPFLLLPIAAEFEDHQFAERVMQVAGIVGAANCFLSSGLFLVVAIVLKELRRLIDGHVVAVHLD